MYDELINNLRSVKDTWQTEDENWMLQAADAIEELQKLNAEITRRELKLRMEKHLWQQGKERQWTSVTEQLPRMWEPVQLMFPENQAVGFWDDGAWGIYSGNGFYTEVAPNETPPTHWKPLSLPPKEESDASL